MRDITRSHYTGILYGHKTDSYKSGTVVCGDMYVLRVMFTQAVYKRLMKEPASECTQRSERADLTDRSIPTENQKGILVIGLCEHLPLYIEQQKMTIFQ